MSNKNEMTKSVALFKSKYGTVMAWDCVPSSTDNVQISEFKEVTFTPLSDFAILDAQLTALEAQEKELNDKYNAALEDIKTRRAQLLALPNLGEQ